MNKLISKAIKHYGFYLALAFCLIMVMGLASAVSIPPVKQGNCINLPQSEFGSSWQNITGIQMPNKTIVSRNIPMTNSNGLFNYTFCDTYQLGTYVVNGKSDLSNWAYDFQVNASGDGELGNSSIALVIILIVFAGLFLLVGYSVDPNKWLIKSALYFTALVIMLINIALGIQLAPSANVNKLMSSALIVGVAAFSLFAIYMFVTYLANIARSFKNARNAKKEEDSWL